MDFARTDRRTSGFTYVETLIAVGLLVIGLLGMAASLLAIRRLNESSLTDSHALAAARTIIEDIQAMDDPEYVLANLHGHTLAIHGVDGPFPDHAFPDGTMPSFRASGYLPPLPGAPAPTPPPPGADPALGYELAGQPILLAPATTEKVGYATLTVDASQQDLVIVHVAVSYSCQGTNRKALFHTQLLRPSQP